MLQLLDIYAVFGLSIVRLERGRQSFSLEVRNLMTDEVLNSLQKIVNELSENMEQLENLIEERGVKVQETFDESRRAIEDLRTLVQGNRQLRVKGVVVRLETLEDEVKAINSERQSERDRLDGMYRGIKLILGVLSVTNAGALITMLAQIFK